MDPPASSVVPCDPDGAMDGYRTTMKLAGSGDSIHHASRLLEASHRVNPSESPASSSIPRLETLESIGGARGLAMGSSSQAAGAQDPIICALLQPTNCAGHCATDFQRWQLGTGYGKWRKVHSSQAFVASIKHFVDKTAWNAFKTKC